MHIQGPNLSSFMQINIQELRTVPEVCLTAVWLNGFDRSSPSHAIDAAFKSVWRLHKHVEKATRLMLAKWPTQRYKFPLLFDFLELIPRKKFLRNSASFQNAPVLTKTFEILLKILHILFCEEKESLSSLFYFDLSCKISLNGLSVNAKGEEENYLCYFLQHFCGLRAVSCHHGSRLNVWFTLGLWTLALWDFVMPF